jgi:hypothetical protein
MLLFYGPVVSADGPNGHSTMVLPTPSIAPKATQVPAFGQILIRGRVPKMKRTPRLSSGMTIIADLLNSLYQNGFYMNPRQGHRIRSANTAND